MSFFKKIGRAMNISPAREATPPKPASKPGCGYCRAVATAGRSGEKTVNFVDGSSVKVEIINESKVPNRLCYTLNIMNDPDVGWGDVPIKYCPFCGKSLRRTRCQ